MSDVLPRVWMLGCGRHSVPHLHLPWEAGTRRPTGPGWAHSYSSQVRPVHNRVMTPAAVRWDLFTIGLWLLLQSGETHVHNWVMTPTAVRWELFKIGLWLLLQSGVNKSCLRLEKNVATNQVKNIWRFSMKNFVLLSYCEANLLLGRASNWFWTSFEPLNVWVAGIPYALTDRTVTCE